MEDPNATTEQIHEIRKAIYQHPLLLAGYIRDVYPNLSMEEREIFNVFVNELMQHDEHWSDLFDYDQFGL